MASKEKCSFCEKPAECWATVHKPRNKDVTFFSCGDKKHNDLMLKATDTEYNSTTGISMMSYNPNES